MIELFLSPRLQTHLRIGKYLITSENQMQQKQRHILRVPMGKCVSRNTCVPLTPAVCVNISVTP